MGITVKLIAKLGLALVSTLMLAGCIQRIETGEVGLRVGFDKQVNLTELQPGTFNQTVIGDVLTFPVRDIALDIQNMTPQAADNSTLADFDMMVIYSINPASVGELYTTKSRGFHAFDNGDWYLMYNYLLSIARSSAYKAVRKHDALKVADARQTIESDTIEGIRATLKEEKLDAALTVNQAQIRNVQPAAAIIQSANDVLRAQNELKTKQIEVETAKKEAERLNALAANKENIRVMELQIQKEMVAALRENKNAIYVIPSNMTSLMLK